MDFKNQTDEIILERLKLGDMVAYEMLFKKYSKNLTLQAFHILKDQMEAEDLVQSIFIDFWDRKLYLNIKSSIKSYLQMTVYNKSISIIRTRQRQQKHLNDYKQDTNQITETNIFERKQSDKDVNLFLAGLSPQRQQAFNLVYMENRKYQEAADEMGISINSIKTHLKIALRILRNKFTN